MSWLHRTERDALGASYGTRLVLYPEVLEAAERASWAEKRGVRRAAAPVPFGSSQLPKWLTDLIGSSTQQLPAQASPTRKTKRPTDIDEVDDGDVDEEDAEEVDSSPRQTVTPASLFSSFSPDLHDANVSDDADDEFVMEAGDSGLGAGGAGDEEGEELDIDGGHLAALHGLTRTITFRTARETARSHGADEIVFDNDDGVQDLSGMSGMDTSASSS